MGPNGRRRRSENIHIVLQLWPSFGPALVPADPILPTQTFRDGRIRILPTLKKIFRLRRAVVRGGDLKEKCDFIEGKRVSRWTFS